MAFLVGKSLDVGVIEKVDRRCLRSFDAESRVGGPATADE